MFFFGGGWIINSSSNDDHKDSLMVVKDKMINCRTSLVPGPSRSNTLLRVPELELELCPPPSGSFLPPSTVTLRVSRVPDITGADKH